MKTPRDFSARSQIEQDSLRSDTWCDKCDQADLGLSDPKEYEEEGRIFVEGRCRKCGGTVRTEVIEQGSA
jgi:hypothetical protein